MGGMSCLKEPLKTAPKTPQPQEKNMELDFFEKVIIPRLEKTEGFLGYEKCERETQYFYILELKLEQYVVIYFDKDTKNFVKIE
jgi:hypothetical protein